MFGWLFGSGSRSKGSSSVRIMGCGDYDYEIVGESNYQDSLEKIVGGKSRESNEIEKIAQLIAEPQNKFDKNAVKVCIDGLTVGYVSRHDARYFQEELYRISRSGIVSCNAMIVGGWKNARSEGAFGVKLDLETPFEVEK